MSLAMSAGSSQHSPVRLCRPRLAICDAAPQLFVSLGVGQGAALAATIVTGIVNHCATYVSFYVADKYGRRVLFIQGE